MKVKIIKSTTDTTWYIDKIGNEYTIMDKRKLPDPYGDYMVVENKGGIYCDDFVIINEYPTLTKEYFE